MARIEYIVDDQTGAPIEYPYISVRSIRVEVSPSEYVWMGFDELHAFANGENLGKWATEKMEAILAEPPERETDY